MSIPNTSVRWTGTVGVSGSPERNRALELAATGVCWACLEPVEAIEVDESNTWTGANCAVCGAHLSCDVLATLIVAKGRRHDHRA